MLSKLIIILANFARATRLPSHCDIGAHVTHLKDGPLSESSPRKTFACCKNAYAALGPSFLMKVDVQAFIQLDQCGWLLTY